KITNSKHQKTNKLQTTSTKFQGNSKLQAPNLKEIPKFIILNFGHCDLFVICNFSISVTRSAGACAVCCYLFDI
ncbi:MAG: hypothetical protein V3S16_10425, partial [Candidatus Desulfatibia sp.]|uniref:hypothetical protein n=1 Tax=Candidatus Desulfatibia sp. TaxID=3101189 RepID=UPI002F2DFF93